MNSIAHGGLLTSSDPLTYQEWCQDIAQIFLLEAPPPGWFLLVSRGLLKEAHGRGFTAPLSSSSWFRWLVVCTNVCSPGVLHCSWFPCSSFRPWTPEIALLFLYLWRWREAMMALKALLDCGWGSEAISWSTSFQSDYQVLCWPFNLSFHALETSAQLWNLFNPASSLTVVGKYCSGLKALKFLSNFIIYYLIQLIVPLVYEF